MNEIECETCIKRKTKYCPNSSECYETKEKPYYQNRIMLLEENQQLKNQLKEKHDGFMASVDEACELAKENQKLKEIIGNIKKFCLSNEWGKYYKISSCRNHILDILNEVE